MKACLVLCEWVNLLRKHNLTQTHIHNHTRQTHKNPKCLKHPHFTPTYYPHFWGLKNWPENFPEWPLFFITPVILIPGAWLQNQWGFQTNSAGKAHLVKHLALPSAREWLNNTYFDHWVCRMPVMRERKTLWGSYTPGHYLLRLSVLLMIRGHQMGNSAWVNDHKRKWTTPMGKLELFMEAVSSPCDLAIMKFLFSQETIL